MAFQITKYKRKTVPANVEPEYIVTQEVVPAKETPKVEKNNTKKTEKAMDEKISKAEEIMNNIYDRKIPDYLLPYNDLE